MEKTISFIHAADLHLDSPFKGLSSLPEQIFNDVKNSTFTALHRLVQTAINKQVDFVLIVGDLFDNDEQSLQAQMALKTACEQLQEQQIEVYLSYGNHDYINGNKYPLDYPSNVHIFSNEKVSSFTYKNLAKIYGFSYENRDVTENKAQQFALSDPEIPFHIGMLHGSLYGSEDHYPYAPFTKTDLLEKDFSYWALGHIHKRKEVNELPPIIYPGNTQGRHRHESGEKGCYYVRMTKNETNLQFIPLQAIEFINTSINLTEASITVLQAELLAILQEKNNRQLVYLTVHLNEKSMELAERVDELIDIVNEQFSNETEWKYIYRYQITVADLPEAFKNDYFVSELEQVFTQMEVEAVLNDLYARQDAKNYLEKLDDSQIKAKAKKLLLNDLLRTRG